jgi:protein-L-isoaspartate(D-aspartate) O-methyltransferase
MIDFAAARRMMVDGQVRTSDVTDPRIIAAMLELPREHFLPESKAALAYLDADVPVTEAHGGKPVRRLLKPMVLAKLVQAAAVQAGDHVLDVG